jgi:hypothetical protein
MLHPDINLWMIEIDRRRERAAMARERHARERMALRPRIPLVLRFRRSAGRRLVKAGIWLISPEVPAHADYAVSRR